MALVGLAAASVPGPCLQRDNPVSGTSRADMTKDRCFVFSWEFVRGVFLRKIQEKQN